MFIKHHVNHIIFHMIFHIMIPYITHPPTVQAACVTLLKRLTIADCLSANIYQLKSSNYNGPMVQDHTA